MIVCTFYTADGLYDREVERLIASADRFNIIVDATEVDDAGNWNANVARKADVIADIMTKYPTLPVLFVDADAVFHGDPTKIFDGIHELGYDFAVRFRGQHLQSGTMWFSGSDRSFALVARWRRERNRLIKVGHKHGHGQRTLQDVLAKSNIKTFDLPVDLCYVFDEDTKLQYARPIIEHMQASRLADGAVHSDEQRAARKFRLAQIDRELDLSLGNKR